MAKKKVVIFGGHGLVGSAIARQLENEEVIIPFHKDCPIENKELVTQLLDVVRPAEIYITAAYTNVDACETDPKAHKVNVLGVHNIVTSKYAQQARVIFFSSGYVFDGTKEKDYDIYDNPCPLTVYGMQKLAGETIALNFCNKDPLIVRTMGVFGKEQARKNFAYQVIDKLGRGEIIYVPDDQYLAPIHADTLAFNVVANLDEYYGIAHVNGRTSMSKARFAKIIATRFGLNIDNIHPLPYEQVAMRPKNAVLQNTVGTSPFHDDLERFYANH